MSTIAFLSLHRTFPFETYKAVMEQGDDITAIEFSAKFDSRLCPVCALMDRQRWTLETINETKIPPLHPNCRCMLLPINEISDSFEREKTGEAENFEQKAKERHNANPKRQKDWDELSYDTRVQKYYDEVKRYENETGKPAYREIGNATFEEYLKSQPAKFQEEWLGKERYQRWKRGELKLDQLVDPDKGYRRTLDDLEKLGVKEPRQGDIKPAIEGEKKYADKPLPELTGQAKEFVQQHELADEIHQRSLKVIDDKLEQIDASGKSDAAKEKDIAVLQKELDKVETAHAKETLESLFGKPAANTSFDFQYQDNFYGNEGRFSDGKKPTVLQKREVKAVVEDAARSVQAVLNNTGIKIKEKVEVYVAKTETGNWHDTGKILIDLKAKGGIVGMPFTFNPFSYTVHELMHEVAEKNLPLRKALTGFFNAHKKGEKIWDAERGFWYADFNIPMPSDYCTLFRKTKNGDEPLEILTMFFTCLLTDTSNRHDMERIIRTGTEFAQKYPEYFNGIMSILRGLKK